ncbi:MULTISPECIES: TRAP transporter substrate-binding protein [Pasteurellaceae]|uniref:TRAP transporter substrate-binding protein n=1 Tax=Pasteurella atlantica TaxID=2827233 RepID=A0AAW8CGE8_9PAST|nr:TRAP transporter substrate-binding protein [Pasteurella atlantica]MBR0573088.1 TRAP transporter substrate-binding protein [Pasteurella atlantica]MDP8039055.1 TRAP transporter substrate-binding protein [Pasteurella atlantica]MDP8041145.1 TRAP transporter substrate-binding protein [Pasteurella atlantica]MDP8043242.1 TRAP transporter substrate-binding protein [Pasteurella atlantica]MDP8045328.1 TRAP transporter substrate-binding protein [Pasteurella atlantica]
MLKRTFLLSSLAATVALTFSVAANASTTLKLSHNQNRAHPVHKALDLMAKRTKELSKGELKIRVYPDAQLGTQRESLELVQKGVLALAKSNAAELEAFSKPYGVYNLPYLFNDKDHYHKVMESKVGQDILSSSEKNGFIGLAYLDAGSRNFYTSKAINSPADLKGLKVRVQPSPTAVSMVKFLGGNPTPLAYGELYTALQQGVVDAAENNIPSFTLSRHSEVAKVFSEDQHTMVPDVLVISTKVWNDLSEKDQKILKQAADEATLAMRDLWVKSENEQRESAIKQGVKFVQVDKVPFKKAVEPMYQELQKNDPETYKIVEEVRKVN